MFPLLFSIFHFFEFSGKYLKQSFIMKTFKIVFLTFSLLLFSLTLDAADFDCGCSTLTPAGSISTGYSSVDGDCCNQLGFAEVITYDEGGNETSYNLTSANVTSHCDGYGC